MKRRATTIASPGAPVRWRGGAQTAESVGRRILTHGIERAIKGAMATRADDRKSPAYLIDPDDPEQVLESHSKLTRIA